jgi:hypothetical protein
VSKAPYVIVGIGLAGCVALAWMAQSLQQRARGGAAGAPRGAAATLAAAFDGRLVGPLAMHDEHQGDLVRRVFVGRAAAGEDQRALARSLAEAARRGSAAGTPCAVSVTLRDADGGNPCTVELLPAAAPPPAAPR